MYISYMSMSLSNSICRLRSIPPFFLGLPGLNAKANFKAASFLGFPTKVNRLGKKVVAPVMIKEVQFQT